MRPTLEICCADAESVAAAVRGGADRIELCSALSEGGLTPSAGMIEMAVASAPEVNVLIRPRRGDFLYTDAEKEMMIRDIRTAVRLGASGVVVGALCRNGDVDTGLLRLMVDAADGRHVTFHRAFDLCGCPEEALEQIICCGCHTLLTSGMASDAMAGAVNIRRMVRLAWGRLEIMAGCGVTPANAGELLRYTNAGALHASASKSVGSRMEHRRQDVSMGGADDEYRRRTTDEETVRQLRTIIDSL